MKLSHLVETRSSPKLVNRLQFISMRTTVKYFTLLVVTYLNSAASFHGKRLQIKASPYRVSIKKRVKKLTNLERSSDKFLDCLSNLCEKTLN